ncbi:MAG TPA: DUF1566 domain-containing protein, partial [Polyangiaceae bacterium]
MRTSRGVLHRVPWHVVSVLVLAACGGFKDQGDHDGGAAADGGGGAYGDAAWPDGGPAHGDSGGQDATGTDATGTDATGIDAAGGEGGGATEAGASDGGGGTDATASEGGGGSDAGDAGSTDTGSGTNETGTAEAGVPEASSPDGSVSCSTTGTADRRFPQWHLPPVGPPLGNYVIASGTVLDLTTGLVWEHQPPPQGLDWPGVNARCAALGTAGQSDWRVPTRAEILTILDYTQIEGQFLDTLVFGNTVPDNGNLVWTSSSVDIVTPATTGEFALDTFNSRTTVVSTDSASLALSMCVRSGCVSTGAMRFVVSTDAAQDTATGLTWQRGTSSSTLSSSAAQAYCSGLSAGGMSTGWRVPSIRELASIFDETQHALPMWDPATFSTSAGTELWSSTPVASDSPYVFTLAFSDVNIYGFI